MKVVGCVLAGSLLLLAAGCSREQPERRIAAPNPPPDPGDRQIVEAHWVDQNETLRDAARSAAASPLVQRAIAGVPVDPRTGVDAEHTIRAIGTASDGSRFRVTLLPYTIRGDATRAAIVAWMERDGRQIAQVSEMISGRIPGPSEGDFELSVIGGHRLWFRDRGTYSLSADGGIHRAPQRTISKEFMRCWLERAVNICLGAANGCMQNAPSGQVPICVAIGCAVGAAVAAGECAFGWFHS